MKDEDYQLDDYDFVKLSRQSKDPKEKQRLLILANLQDGKTQSTVADSLKISVPTVKRTLKRFRASGLSDLKDHSHPGVPAKLSATEMSELKATILEQQEQRLGGRLTGYDIQALIEDKWGVSYGLSTVYTLLAKLNLSWISSRSRHPKQCSEKQAAFKKTSAPRS